MWCIPWTEISQACNRGVNNMACLNAPSRQDPKGPFSKVSWFLFGVSIALSIVSVASDNWLHQESGQWDRRGLWRACVNDTCHSVTNTAPTSVWTRNEQASQAFSILSILTLFVAMVANSAYLFILQTYSDGMAFISICNGFAGAGFLLVNVLVFGISSYSSGISVGWSLGVAILAVVIIFSATAFMFIEYAFLLRLRLERKAESLADNDDLPGPERVAYNPQSYPNPNQQSYPESTSHQPPTGNQRTAEQIYDMFRAKGQNVTDNTYRNTSQPDYNYYTDQQSNRNIITGNPGDMDLNSNRNHYPTPRGTEDPDYRYDKVLKSDNNYPLEMPRQEKPNDYLHPQEEITTKSDRASGNFTPNKDYPNYPPFKEDDNHQNAPNQLFLDKTKKKQHNYDMFTITKKDKSESSVKEHSHSTQKHSNSVQDQSPEVQVEAKIHNQLAEGTDDERVRRKKRRRKSKQRAESNEIDNLEYSLKGPNTENTEHMLGNVSENTTRKEEHYDEVAQRRAQKENYHRRKNKQRYIEETKTWDKGDDETNNRVQNDTPNNKNQRDTPNSRNEYDNPNSRSQYDTHNSRYQYDNPNSSYQYDTPNSKNEYDTPNRRDQNEQDDTIMQDDNIRHMKKKKKRRSKRIQHNDVPGEENRAHMQGAENEGYTPDNDYYSPDQEYTEKGYLQVGHGGVGGRRRRSNPQE